MIGTAIDLPRPRLGLDAPSAFPNLASRRVLVTGARGFIGGHLLAHLLDGAADVHAVARPGRAAPHASRRALAAYRSVTWHEADLADPDQSDRAIRDSDPEIIFHLASTVTGHRGADAMSVMLDNNTRAAVNVLSAAHRLGNRRVILAGSVEEPHHAGEAPCSPYAAAKVAATTCSRLFHQQWGLPVTVLRPAMVYGPDQPDQTKLLPYVIGCMLDGRAPQLTSGTRPIDWVHVDDVCRAFLLAAVHPSAPGLVADIGSGTATTIADTVRLIATSTGYGGPIGFGDVADRENDAAHIADVQPALTVLGWRTTTSLTQGLAQTVHWYRAGRDIGHGRARAGGAARDEVAVLSSAPRARGCR